MYDYDYGYDYGYGGDIFSDIISSISSLLKIIGLIVAVLGFVQCVFGYKILKVILAIRGFFTGFIVGVTLGLCFSLKADDISTVLGMMAFFGIIAAIAGAYFSYSFYKFGVFIAGFSFTFVLNAVIAFIMVFSSQNIDAGSLIGSLIFAAVPSIGVGVLMVKFTKPLMIIGTAIGGAAECVAGISMLFSKSPSLLFFILCAVGIYYQCKSNGGLTEKKAAVSQNAIGNAANTANANGSVFNYQPITNPAPKTVDASSPNENDDIPNIED